MNIGQRILIGLIRLYKKIISPLLPNTCRFYPSCSSYMAEAIEKKRYWKGILPGGAKAAALPPVSPRRI